MKSAKQQLRPDKAVLEQAIHTARGSIILTDNQQPDNPIVYCNPAFLELTGYTEDEVLGNNCRFLQGKDTDKKAINQLKRAVTDGNDERVVIKNYRKDGTAFWNDLIISPVKNSKGDITHFLGMQLDITSQVEQTETLRISAEKLARSNKELEQFTYAVSHDLQEPLRMVTSFMELLQKRYQENLDEKANTYIDFAVEGATRMQGLVADLLLLSRVRTKAEPNISVDMNEVIDIVSNNLKMTIEESDANIRTPGKLPVISADKNQMVQLFQNLISNAIKYQAKDSKPDVKINCKKDGNYWVFSVKDNGIGIDKQYHERIFAVFQRLHTRQEYPGTGVGLAICKKIVDRHDGELRVISSPGNGSEFIVKLPSSKEVRK